MGLRVEFDEKATGVIQFLRVALELESDTEVLTRAIALLRVCTEANLRGESVCITNENDAKRAEIILK